MFVEQKGGAPQAAEGKWAAAARRRPGVFTVFLVVLTIVVAGVLLYQRGASFVLYQGF